MSHFCAVKHKKTAGREFYLDFSSCEPRGAERIQIVAKAVDRHNRGKRAYAEPVNRLGTQIGVTDALARTHTAHKQCARPARGREIHRARFRHRAHDLGAARALSDHGG